MVMMVEHPKVVVVVVVVVGVGDMGEGVW